MNTMLKKLNSKRNGKKGFTLMEMLIVVAIIAILVAIAIPTFTGALTKAKKATDDANIRAAFAEYQVSQMDSEISKGPTIDAATDTKNAIIHFAEGGEYELKVYKNINRGVNPWIGSET